MFDRAYLLKLIIPLVLEQLLAVTIGMADTVMVASAGEAAVSGISLVDSISVLIIQIFAAFATGGAVVSSQYLGRRDGAAANSAAKQLLILSLVVSVAIMLLCLPFRRQIVRLIFGAIDDDVMANCVIYFLYVLISIPFLAIYNGSAALFRSMGNSKISLYVSLVMNIINISGNAYLIFGRHMGVAGAGIATMVSRMVAAIVMTKLICNRKNKIHVEHPWKFEWRPAMIKRILNIGIPNGVEGSVFQIGKLLVQGIIADFGTASIAANAIANSLGSFVNIPGNAFGLASITVIGQCVGARQTDQAVYYSKKLLGSTYLAMAALGAPLYIFAPQIVMIFNLSAEATAMAATVIKTCMVASALIWPMAFTVPNFLRAAGDAKFTMVVSMISMWTFRVGMSHIFAVSMGLGMIGVWFAMYTDWICRSICFVHRFIKGKWKTKIVI